ncbi:hypothetical protein [Microvirga pakistanensis]|nr:hypothetical protein [Microvirga pakistanensis]
MQHVLLVPAGGDNHAVYFTCLPDEAVVARRAADLTGAGRIVSGSSVEAT